MDSLNRSFSAPNVSETFKFPIKRKIVINEVIQYLDTAPLIRQYSCEEVFHHNGDYSFQENTKFNMLKNKPLPLEYNSPVTPMEIDEITDSPQLAFCDDLTNNVKIRNLNLNSNSDKTIPLKRKRLLSTKTVLHIFIILISVYVCINRFFVYTNTLIRLDDIKNDLLNEVIGQDDAINVVIKNLQNLQVLNNSVTVLPFIGSTGVGKTHFVNILKRHFQNLFFEINQSKLNNLITKNLHSNSMNLIIIDDLHWNNVENVIHYITTLPENCKILIVLMFNTNIVDANLNYSFDINNVNYIIDRFKKTTFCYDVVLFNDISLENIKLWTIKELTNLGIPVHRREAILNSVIKSHDLKYGFKGLHSKLLLEIEHV